MNPAPYAVFDVSVVTCFVVVYSYLISCEFILIVALWNRADHYIFALWFLSIFLFILA